ncbi:hypothetical protein RHMOL_Rhmol11G0086100 [Rhododendron molle]|uniref:Uncharacterized protein n=1 Tax=Rhododendron molle TaxID=49168 RepID=A0ACC0LR06_RHOML|nr:hypothetical protein RHMOL_Rhmol11G0086100 [Rhododendron molle]
MPTVPTVHQDHLHHGRKRSTTPLSAKTFFQLCKALTMHSWNSISTKTSPSVAHSLAVLETSYPPLAGAFWQDLRGFITPILDFQLKIGSNFLINAYPYFAYKGNQKQVLIDFVMFQAHVPAKCAGEDDGTAPEKRPGVAREEGAREATAAVGGSGGTFWLAGGGAVLRWWVATVGLGLIWWAAAVVCLGTMCDEGIDQLQHVLPKGIWLSFDFGDSHPDIPALYLQGGSIIPVGPAIQHVGEANPTDDLLLLVALDEHGKAKGVLFEDDGDGYEFTRGGYLLTTYVAEHESSVVTVKIAETEGSLRRPNRRLHIQLLLGGCAKLDAWGVDGEIIQVKMPSEDEVSKLVSTSEKQYKIGMETARHIPDVEKVSGHTGIELSRTPIELKRSVWALKVVPWIGGRIISMEHLPSALVDLLLIILGDTVPGTQWLHSRVEVNGYEEFSGTEYRSAGWSEPYNVIERNLEQAGERESLMLEGDIGGGLVIERQISFPEDNSNIFRIDSRILARTVGAGSGGFSRLVCLRVHPMFTLLHPTESYVSFTSIDGSKHEVWPESNEMFFEGDLRPNGEWMLFDKCTGLGLVNRFNVSEIHKCLVHWGTGTVNLELWSEDRPVSKESPLRISHEYEVTSIT